MSIHSTCAPHSATGGWYAVRTQAKREALAVQHLQNQNFSVFFPKALSRVRRRRGGPPASSQPFFPGYVFVRLDLNRDRWRCVNSTIGVIGLVQFGARPASTPRGFVEALQARTNADGVLTPRDDLKIGDVVRILGGPFDQTIATLFAHAADQRVSVLVSMMTRDVQIEMPRAALLPLKPANAAMGGHYRHQ
jgi:transcription elongation factor/antiterminator RfaH